MILESTIKSKAISEKLELGKSNMKTIVRKKNQKYKRKTALALYHFSLHHNLTIIEKTSMQDRKQNFTKEPIGGKINMTLNDSVNNGTDTQNEFILN